MQNNNEKLQTFGDTLRNARLEKNITIEELIDKFANSKLKVSYKVNDRFRYYEKKIKSWENGKDYPNLDEIYELASILEINPNRLLILRDKVRNNYKKVNVFRKESKLFKEMPDSVYFGLQFMLRVFIFLAAVYFIIKYCQLFIAFAGGGTEKLERAVNQVTENYVDEK